MIRVCIVEDQTIVRQGLCSLLGLTPDIVVGCEATDGVEALEVIERERQPYVARNGHETVVILMKRVLSS